MKEECFEYSSEHCNDDFDNNIDTVACIALRKAYVVNFTKAKTPQKTPQVVVIKLW